MKKLIFCITMLLVAFIFSCSVKPAIEQTIDNNLLVKVAVAEVLYKNPTWKPEVNKICLALLSYDEAKTIDDLEKKAYDEINKLDVSPATKTLAQELLIGISTGIKADFQRQNIIDINTQLLKTVDFIIWLEAATKN